MRSSKSVPVHPSVSRSARASSSAATGLRSSWRWARPCLAWPGDGEAYVVDCMWPLLKGERLEQGGAEQLADIGKRPSLVRSFFKH